MAVALTLSLYLCCKSREQPFSSLETETFESNRKDKALDMLMSKCDVAMLRGTIE